MAKVIAYAWRLRDGETEKLRYRAQVENVDGRSHKSVKKAFSEWKPSGFCFPVAAADDYHLYFVNEYETYEDFVSWAKSFPYKITELSSTSDVAKSIKLGLDTKKKSKRGRPKKEKSQKTKNRTNICGHCGEKGHNRRTCPVLKIARG